MKIDFEFETSYGKFADALHLPDDHTFTEAEIQVMKETRRDNWIALLTAPPPEPSLTTVVDGELYKKLESVPSSGAKLIEVEGVWYYKV